MSSKRGKRSVEAAARRYVLNFSFRDRVRAETVATVTNQMVIQFLQKDYSDVPPPSVVVDRGDILIDSRGQGSFQK